MSSSSGVDSRTDKSSALNKIKPLANNRDSNSSYTIKCSQTIKSKANLLTPPSLELQHIINNTLILNISQSAFNCIKRNLLWRLLQTILIQLIILI
jgi:hypothetical protein